MLLKYLWNLILVTSYLLERDTACDYKCNNFSSDCPELASYLFLSAITLWFCGRNLIPPCLSIPCKLSPLYHFVAIPVLSSVIHRLIWTDLIGFLTVVEYFFHQMISVDGKVDYQSIFDPTLAVSLSDVIGVAALGWVLKSYLIIECIISIINKLTGCAKPNQLPCAKEEREEQESTTCPFVKKEPLKDRDEDDEEE